MEAAATSSGPSGAVVVSNGPADVAAVVQAPAKVSITLPTSAPALRRAAAAKQAIAVEHRKLTGVAAEPVVIGREDLPDDPTRVYRDTHRIVLKAKVPSDGEIRSIALRLMEQPAGDGGGRWAVCAYEAEDGPMGESQRFLVQSSVQEIRVDTANHSTAQTVAITPPLCVREGQYIGVQNSSDSYSPEWEESWGPGGIGGMCLSLDDHSDHGQYIWKFEGGVQSEGGSRKLDTSGRLKERRVGFCAWLSRPMQSAPAQERTSKSPGVRVEELGEPPDTVARHPTAPSPARLSESDLEAFLEPWYPSLKATLDELGAEAVEDLKELEAEHIDALASKLKVLQAKKFRKKLSTLAGAAEAAAAAPGPLATVGHVGHPNAHAPRVSLQAPVPAATTGKRLLFGSMRFKNGGILPEALALRAELAKHGAHLMIIDMSAGGDIDTNVFAAIEACDTFVVFGTAGYGEDTGNQASTFYESKYAHGKQKRTILIRMIPFDQDFDHLQGRVVFGMNKLCLGWMEGKQMPPNIVADILKAIGDPSTAPPPAA